MQISGFLPVVALSSHEAFSETRLTTLEEVADLASGEQFAIEVDVARTVGTHFTKKQHIEASVVTRGCCLYKQREAPPATISRA